jgi:hypothetical protein
VPTARFKRFPVKLVVAFGFDEDDARGFASSASKSSALGAKRKVDGCPAPLPTLGLFVALTPRLTASNFQDARIDIAFANKSAGLDCGAYRV